MIHQIVALLSVVSAVSVPATAKPLCTDATATCDSVDLQKYLGDWFEIGNTAIIRNTIQRGCQCVEAN
jgi:lipocalin